MLERHDAGDGQRTARLTSDHRKVVTIPKMVDREVPLSGAASMSISDVPKEVHEWLDGEVSEGTARRADNRNVELWTRIQEETTRRRRLSTPSYMSDRVMAVLPSKAPSRFAMFFRPFRITPIKAVAIGGGLFAAGMLGARAFFS